MRPAPALVLAVFALELSGCCAWSCRWCDPESLILEYDSIGTAVAVTAAPASAFGQSGTAERTIANALGECRISATKIGDAISTDWNPEPKCVTLASLDQQIACTKGGNPDPAAWYVHGLAVPWKPQWLLADGSIGCIGVSGLLWQAGGTCAPGPVSETGVREDFVVFHDPAWTPAVAMVNGLHELGHVLNVHDGDYGPELEARAQLEGTPRRHLCEALQANDPQDTGARHVRPGPDALPYCHMTPDHTAWHGGGSSCGAAPPAPPAIPAADLLVEPEKTRYCPGEPVTVNITMTARLDLEYRSETGQNPSSTSLDPAYGYLLLWQDLGGGKYGPISTLVYFDTKLSFAPLAAGDSQRFKGIQIWYGTGVDQSRPFTIEASYAGFPDPRAAVVSPPVTVSIVDDGTGKCHKKARRLFNDAEARRVVWLMGGDHLEHGVDHLVQISDDHPQTVYAAYANLALAYHWARPFHFLDEAGAMDRRDPVLQKAALYAGRLQSQDQIQHLPPSLRTLASRIPGIHEP